MQLAEAMIFSGRRRGSARVSIKYKRSINNLRQYIRTVIITAMLVIFSAISTFAGDTAEVNFIAHRGLRGQAPMNTTSAFKEAISAGCIGIETDIRLSSDGYIVCFHDRSIGDTTNGSGNVSSNSFNELKQVKFTKVDGLNRYPDAKIASFFEYLQLCRNYNKLAVIDIKFTTNYKELLDKAYYLTKMTGMIDNAVFQCDDPDFLFYLTSKYPDVRTWYLITGNIDEADVRIANKIGCEAINSNRADYDSVNLGHENGLKVCYYSANTNSEVNRLLACGVDYIMTDGYSMDIFNTENGGEG